MRIHPRHTVLITMVAIWLSAIAVRADQPVWLGSLDLSQMTTGWSVAKADRGVVGRPLSIRGQKYVHGVGTHAVSDFRVDSAGHARRFTAQVGVDDSAGGKGSVEFIVLGDGKVLWRSGILTGQDPAQAVDVALMGIKTLGLRVTDGGDGASDDHADWADAKIDMEDGAPLPLTLPPQETFEVRTKTFTLNFRVGDDGRLYQQAVGTASSKTRVERDEETYPQAGDGYIWEPALQVVHADGNTSTALVYDGVTATNGAGDVAETRVALHDPAYPFQVTLCFRTHFAEDVVEQWTEIRHQEPGPVILERMASTSLLLSTNIQLTHFFGNWAREMLEPTTELLTPGIKVLDSKLGVRASQFGSPSFVLSLDGEPSESTGRVLAGSLAWSGNYQCAFENNGTGVRAVCGINPFASAFHLPPDQTFTTPVMIWVWSQQGLGDMSRKFHRWARDFGIRDGHRTRDVLLNNWEATGFDFDFNRIVSLFDPAKEMGTELFLLDDGWFGNQHPRINDRAGLGDWQANQRRLPGGLAPLAAEAAKRGLRFGIWLEPEMVNPHSDLYERHPDWVLGQPKRELELQRNQLILDLSRPAVEQFEWESIKDILSVPGITYAKWDCNRYLSQPGSTYLDAAHQSELGIDYVNALYRLMEKTAHTFPDTELMLCASGGGRMDYGALKYFHDFWPSDNTDPAARVLMQWGYSYFFPPMALASHVTHTGNRPMHFACSVAMSARFGMDLDLTKLTAEDRSVLAGAIAAYKKIRVVTQLGDLYRLEDPHAGARGALNFVAPDQSRAVVFVFQLKDGAAKAVCPQGLDPGANYALHELNPLPGRPALPQDGAVLTGATLMRDGFSFPEARALEAWVVELDRQ